MTLITESNLLLTRIRLHIFFSIELLLTLFATIPLARSEAEKPSEQRRLPIPIADTKRSATVDFEKEILPILKNNCLACHNQTKAKADLVLETPQTILKGGESGPAVAPEKSGESLLLQLAAHQKKPMMPPKDNKAAAADLTSEELGLIKLWIDQGAKGEVHGSGPIVWQPLPEGLNPIYAVAVTPDGQFAACGRANQIFIYHLPSGRIVTRLTDPALFKETLYGKLGVAHRDMVNSLAFSPDGETLASGDYRAVKLWHRPKNVQKSKLASLANKPLQSFTASPDGKWLATGDEYGVIQLWDSSHSKLEKEFGSQQSPVTCLAFSPDSKKICSGSIQKMIHIWSVPEGFLLGRLETPSEVNALSWLAGGKQIVSGGGDHSIRIWQLPDQAKGAITLIKEFKGHDGPVTSLAIGVSSNQILSGSSDGSVRLWNVESGELIRKMDQSGAVSIVAVRGDGKRFASAGLNVAKLWNAEGKLVAEMKGDRYTQELVSKQERALSFAKSEVAYRKANLESALKEQKAETERVAKALEARVTAEKNLTEKQKTVLSAVEARAAAEKALAELSAGLQKVTDARDAAQGLANQADAEAKSASERVSRSKANAEAAAKIRVETEKLAAEDTTKSKLLADTKAIAGQLAADAAAVAADAKIVADRLIAEAAAKSKAAAEARTAAEKAIAELPEKQKMATEKITATLKVVADAEKEVKQTETAKSVAEDQLQAAQASGKKAADALPLAKAGIEAAEEQQRKTETSLDVARKASADSEKPIRTIAFSPDNLTIATAGDDQQVHTWSAENGAPFETFKGHEGPVSALAFLDEKRVLSAGMDRSAIVWDLNPDWNLERVIGSGDATSPLIDRVNALSFSPDGQLLATGSGEPSRSGELKIWKVATGEFVQEIKNAHSDVVLGIDFSADGKFLVSGAADKFVKVFELGGGKLVKSFEGHTHHVLGVSWKRDGRTLASCGADKVIKVWDMVTGEQRKTIDGVTKDLKFTKEVTSIRYLDSSNEFLVASGDNQVGRLREDGENARTFAGATDFIQSASITPDGKVVLGGGQDGVLRVWNGTNGEVIQTFSPPKTDDLNKLAATSKSGS